MSCYGGGSLSPEQPINNNVNVQKNKDVSALVPQQLQTILVPGCNMESLILKCQNISCSTLFFFKCQPVIQFVFLAV